MATTPSPTRWSGAWSRWTCHPCWRGSRISWSRRRPDESYARSGGHYPQGCRVAAGRLAVARSSRWTAGGQMGGSAGQQGFEVAAEGGVGVGDDFGGGDLQAGTAEAGQGQAHGDAVVVVGFDGDRGGGDCGRAA